jgi:hypothetical protein
MDALGKCTRVAVEQNQSGYSNRENHARCRFLEESDTEQINSPYANSDFATSSLPAALISSDRCGNAFDSRRNYACPPPSIDLREHAGLIQSLAGKTAAEHPEDRQEPSNTH